MYAIRSYYGCKHHPANHRQARLPGPDYDLFTAASWLQQKIAGGSISSPDKAGTDSWRDAVAVYLQPRIAGMVFLGFSAGLPFLLVFSTLSAWLSTAGIDRTTIGFFSWRNNFV